MHQHSIIVSFCHALHQSKSFVGVYMKSQKFWNFIWSLWHSFNHLLIKKIKRHNFSISVHPQFHCIMLQRFRGDSQEYWRHLNLCRVLIIIENHNQMVQERFICIWLSIHEYSISNSMHSQDICIIYTSQHAFHSE